MRLRARHPRRLLPISVATLAALVWVLPASDSHGAEGDIDAREQELRTIELEMQQLSQDMDIERRQREDLQNQLRSLEEAVAVSAGALRRLDEELSGSARRLRELELERAEKQRALGEARSRLSAQLRAAHALGRQDRLKLILNQEDPADLSRLLAYHDYLTRARVEQLAAVTSRARELDEVVGSLSAQRANLGSLRSERENELAELAQKQEQRRTVLEELDRLLDAQGRKLQDLTTDAEAMRQLIDSLRREAVMGIGGNFDPIARLKGKLPWPLRGRLAVRYGTPKEADAVRWDGVLIEAQEGDEVRAVHIGRVIYADWLRGFGLLLIVDHGDGYMTLYGHNRVLLKEVGEWVVGGDVIALVGDSGGLTRPALYFALRHEGKPIDPVSWCVRGRGARVGSAGGDAKESGTFSGLFRRTQLVSMPASHLAPRRIRR